MIINQEVIEAIDAELLHNKIVHSDLIELGDNNFLYNYLFDFKGRKIELFVGNTSEKLIIIGFFIMMKGMEIKWICYANSVYIGVDDIINKFEKEGWSVNFLNYKAIYSKLTISNETNLDKDCMIYKDVFEQTKQMIAIMDNSMSIIFANNALLDYIDDEIEEIKGMAYWDLPVWRHSVDLQNKIMFSLERMYLGETVMFETTHEDKLGRIRDVDFVVKPILNESGDIVRLIAMGYDVTELKLAESALKKTERDLKLFFDYSIEGYSIFRLNESVYINEEKKDEIISYIIENEKLSNFNEAVFKQFELSRDEYLKGELNQKLFESIDKKAVYSLMIQNGSIKYFVDTIICEKEFVIECIMIPMYEADGAYSGHFRIIKDITENKKLERQLKFLANKDFLTGTNNRRYYLDLVKEKLELVDVESAILMLDLDFFKKVNDQYGHDAGDKVLIEVVKIMEESIDGAGFLGRMGGEEFSAYLEGNTLIEKAEAIREAIEKKAINIGTETINITVSIGLSYIKLEITLEQVFKSADNALYKAKDSGRNKVVIL